MSFNQTYQPPNQKHFESRRAEMHYFPSRIKHGNMTCADMASPYVAPRRSAATVASPKQHPLDLADDYLNAFVTPCCAEYQNTATRLPTPPFLFCYTLCCAALSPSLPLVLCLHHPSLSMSRFFSYSSGALTHHSSFK